MGQKFREVVDKKVRGEFGKSMTAKAIGHATDPGAGVACRQHVNVGIADEHDLGVFRALADREGAAQVP